MDGYISKPFDSETLIEIVEGFVSSRATMEEPQTGGGEAVFDRETALMYLSGDRNLFKDIAGLFEEQSPSILARIRGAIENRDGEELRQAAHRLKSSVGVFMARQALDGAVKMEKLGLDSDFEAASDLYPELEAHIIRLADALTHTD